MYVNSHCCAVQGCVLKASEYQHSDYYLEGSNLYTEDKHSTIIHHLKLGTRLRRCGMSSYNDFNSGNLQQCNKCVTDQSNPVRAGVVCRTPCGSLRGSKRHWLVACFFDFDSEILFIHLDVYENDFDAASLNY